MIDVRQYIQLVMEKKGLTQSELVRRINAIEKEHNEKRLHLQNLNECLNERLPFRPKLLIKIELALELPYGTLVNMVMPPLSKSGKEELEKWKKAYRG